MRGGLRSTSATAPVLRVRIAELLEHLLLLAGDGDKVQQEDEQGPCEGERVSLQGWRSDSMSTAFDGPKAPAFAPKAGPMMGLMMVTEGS